MFCVSCAKLVMNITIVITITWLLVCRLMNTFSCRPRRCSARPAERPGMENGDDDNDGDDHNDLLDNHWDNDHKKIK